MTEEKDDAVQVRLVDLSLEQTIRWRALDLAVASARDTIRFGKDIEFHECTSEIITRADEFYGYVFDASTPEPRSADRTVGDE